MRVRVIREDDSMGYRNDAPLIGCVLEYHRRFGQLRTEMTKGNEDWWFWGKDHKEVGDTSYCTFDEYHWYMELETVEELWDVIRKTYGSLVYYGGYPAILLPEGYDVEEEEID